VNLLARWATVSFARRNLYYDRRGLELPSGMWCSFGKLTDILEGVTASFFQVLLSLLFYLAEGTVCSSETCPKCYQSRWRNIPEARFVYSHSYGRFKSHSMNDFTGCWCRRHCIRKVLVSNLDPDTGYLHWLFCLVTFSPPTPQILDRFFELSNNSF
jgi:hypothetical protein